MNKDLIDGLKRRFDIAEKNKFTTNRLFSFFEYFLYIIKNPLLLDTAKIQLDKGAYLDDELITCLFVVSIQNDNFTFLSAKSPCLKRFSEKIYKDWKENNKPTEDEISLNKELDAKEVGQLHELTLNYLATFHNELIDNLSSSGAKIPLYFSTSKGLCIGSDSDKCYRSKAGSDRLDYLQRIISKKGKSVSAKELVKGLEKGLNYKIIVSSEIKKINYSIMNELGLKDEVILGKNGYRFNTDKYQIFKG